jgi:hypothetical protein
MRRLFERRDDVDASHVTSCKDDVILQTTRSRHDGQRRDLEMQSAAYGILLRPQDSFQKQGPNPLELEVWIEDASFKMGLIRWAQTLSS